MVGLATWYAAPGVVDRFNAEMEKGCLDEYGSYTIAYRLGRSVLWCEEGWSLFEGKDLIGLRSDEDQLRWENVSRVTLETGGY
jgi:hypothetical protein